LKKKYTLSLFNLSPRRIMLDVNARDLPQIKGVDFSNSEIKNAVLLGERQYDVLLKILKRRKKLFFDLSVNNTHIHTGWEKRKIENYYGHRFINVPSYDEKSALIIKCCNLDLDLTYEIVVSHYISDNSVLILGDLNVEENKQFLSGMGGGVRNK